MAYKIQYSPEQNYLYPPLRKMKKRKWKGIVCAVLVFFAVIWLSQKGIPDVLIPGDPACTRAAAAELVILLEEGVPIDQAVTAFCEQIIHGAD